MSTAEGVSILSKIFYVIHANRTLNNFFFFVLLFQCFLTLLFLLFLFLFFGVVLEFLEFSFIESNLQILFSDTAGFAVLTFKLFIEELQDVLHICK